MAKNAADEGQVKEARRRELEADEEAKQDLATILKFPEGRRFCASILDLCKFGRSSWDNSARIHYLTAVRDIGDVIASRIIDASPDHGVRLIANAYRKEKGIEVE